MGRVDILFSHLGQEGEFHISLLTYSSFSFMYPHRMLANQKTPLVYVKESDRKWWVVDLSGQTLGRVATRIAGILRGKHNPTFSPQVDNGDFVIAINAEKIHLTGNKWEDKKYYRHSGYPGGLKETSAKELVAKHPDQLITKAVERMLPKNSLSKQMMTKFKVYAGVEHPHAAQKPIPLKLQ